MATVDNAMFFTNLMSSFLKKIVIPGDFKGQADAVENMLQDDVTGLIDSLTDFAVTSASVEYGIETDNDRLNKILNRWLHEVNKDYNGKVPPGINALAKEYFKERWKGASFPVLKITKWESVEGLQLPSRMFFVDGGDIQAKEKNSKDSQVTLFSYDYYLGDTDEAQNKLDRGTIFSRPYGRWHDKYPVPYLIKRGVYHNYKIIQSIKELGKTVLEEVIPYLMIIKKGSPELTEQGKTYSDPELKQVFESIQALLREAKANPSSYNGQTQMRVTDYAEEIKHLIPDLSTVFAPKLYVQAERNILSGLGFIDVVQGVSETRRESVLNPKAFIEEIQSGVKDFQQLIYQLMLLIKEANRGNKKYMGKDFTITASPVTAFMSDKFKQELRLLWKHGLLSDQTYCEMVGEVSFKGEVDRRKKEAKDGTETIMYPHITDNKEGDISPDEYLRNEKRGLKNEETDVNGDPIQRDKIDDTEQYNVSGNRVAIIKCHKCGFKFDMLKEKESHMGAVKCPKCGIENTQRDIIKSENKDLEIAPYKTPADLPAKIKKSLSPGLQGTFVGVFNKALESYKSETSAFRVAWSVIKKIARINKKGIWIRKARLTQAVLNCSMAEIDNKNTNQGNKKC